MKVVAAVLAATLSSQSAQTAATRASARPPAVGDSLATIAGLDQSGASRTARSLTGPKGAVITILRSADWCPICKVQLVELEAGRPLLHAAGYGLAAVTIDPVPVLAGFAAKRRIGFPMLAGRRIIADLGIVDTRFDGDAQRAGAPHPVVYVVDASLVITRAFPEGERHTVASMLAHIGIARGASPLRHETPHLTTAAWASDGEVDANRRFALVVDVEPRASMHVYAPGAHTYKPIRLVIDPQPGLILSALEFPASEPYVFKALNETVPVYARPFRLAQDVMVQRAPNAPVPAPPRELRVSGRLEYQACDDVVCYAASTVPLEWRVTVR